MNIAIGILAHNEEKRIQSTLYSLLDQTIFDSSSRKRLGIERVQVACVANGCTDQTSARVREIFDRRQTTDELSFEVCDLPEAGKSRSWNVFVHSVSDVAADYLAFLDADIEFGTGDVLEKLVLYLESRPETIVATDKPVKLTRKKSELSIQEAFSLAASEQIEAGGLSGQLYCGRSLALRRIWMPLALPVEDGFLGAMIVTDGFTKSDDWGKIAQAPNVFHYFETHENLSEFIRHESRIVVGSVINSWLFNLLWEKGKKGHVGNYIKNQNEQYPHWLDDLVKHRISSARWLVPQAFLMKRLFPLRQQPLFKRLKMSPTAILSTLIQIVVCARANQILRRSGSAHFW